MQSMWALHLRALQKIKLWEKNFANL